MKICKIKGCSRSTSARGWCKKHYETWRLRGDPEHKDSFYHKKSHTSIYYCWTDMKTRCLNPNNSGYKYYGGRGIKICERWMDFRNFYLDMGDKPKDMQLDRINNNGNYEPNNCRWVTSAENNQNQRTTKLNAIKVREIRRVYPIFSRKHLAEKYQVTYRNIYDIVNNKTWKNILI